MKKKKKANILCIHFYVQNGKWNYGNFTECISVLIFSCLF